MTRDEALVEWLIEESSKRFESKWFHFARHELLKAMGLPVPELGVWSETVRQDALAHFNACFPHD